MSESTPARPGAGQREMMFCHECHDEWYRDERGIICPECDSEFTEVVGAPFGHATALSAGMLMLG